MEIHLSKISIDELNYVRLQVLMNSTKDLPIQVTMSLLIKNPNFRITQFQWNDWKKFLSNKFLPCNGIHSLE